MSRKDFMIEEYKALQVGIAKHQAAYFTLENFTFGGMLVVYGVLFGVTAQTQASIPLIAWWIVFILVLIACIRCWGHYIVVRKLASYIALIEKSFYFDHSNVIGFERFLLKGKIKPWMNLAANAIAWSFLLAISGGIAMAKTYGIPIP